MKTLPMPSSRPHVSWLMCANRVDHLLPIAVESCLRQSLRQLELIFVANGPDATAVAEAVGASFGRDRRVRILRTHVRQLNFSLSLGLHVASAAMVARMDADDVTSPERLDSQLAFLESHPEVVVVGSNYRLIGDSGEILGHRSLPASDQEIRVAMRTRNPLCHPSVMFRRDAIRKAGGYLGSNHAEDYDLWVRLARDPSQMFANIQVPFLDYRAGLAGAARRSRSAYAAVAAVQFREFAESGHPTWLAGSLLTLGKAMYRSQQP